ncbi:hypothetical protein RB195_003804 [Necator americanus]|uniref:Uncharacterized protein n=1 Tax=Necator americanus TaxID=51031 RepID=A0ABR1DQ84_NECAM
MDTLFCWFAPIIIVVLSSFSEQIVSFNESVREDRGGWAELCSSTTPSGKIREITAGDNINPAINSGIGNVLLQAVIGTEVGD